MSKTAKLVRCIHRTYRDSGQVTVYFEWENGSRTECPAEDVCQHPAALFAYVLRNRVPFVSEVW